MLLLQCHDDGYLDSLPDPECANVLVHVSSKQTQVIGMHQNNIYRSDNIYSLASSGNQSKVIRTSHPPDTSLLNGA